MQNILTDTIIFSFTETQGPPQRRPPLPACAQGSWEFLVLKTGVGGRDSPDDYKTMQARRVTLAHCHVNMAHRRVLPSPSLFGAGLSGTLVARQSDGTKMVRAQGGVGCRCVGGKLHLHTDLKQPVLLHIYGFHSDKSSAEVSGLKSVDYAWTVL